MFSHRSNWNGLILLECRLIEKATIVPQKAPSCFRFWAVRTILVFGTYWTLNDHFGQCWTFFDQKSVESKSWKKSKHRKKSENFFLIFFNFFDFLAKRYLPQKNHSFWHRFGIFARDNVFLNAYNSGTKSLT